MVKKFVEKFGKDEKEVTFDGQKLTIDGNIVDFDEVVAVYAKDATLTKQGFVKFSEYVSQDIFSKKDLWTFQFKRNETLKVEKILSKLDVDIAEGRYRSQVVSESFSTFATEIKAINGVHCPACSSTNVEFMQNDRKGFSVGKAAGGVLLTGGVGSLAGFAGKKGKYDIWHCKDCGKRFKK